jgi:hypothetical protein
MAGMIGGHARKFGVDGMSKDLFAGPAAITMARGCKAPPVILRHNDKRA